MVKEAAVPTQLDKQPKSEANAIIEAVVDRVFAELDKYKGSKDDDNRRFAKEVDTDDIEEIADAVVASVMAILESLSITPPTVETVGNLAVMIDALVRPHVQALFSQKIDAFNPATGLPINRIGKSVVRALIQSNRDFCLTFFDIDHFKALNTALGQHIADRVLRKIVEERFLPNIRRNQPDGQNDLLYSRSGDEFQLVINGADLREGLIVCNKLLNALRSTPVSIVISEADAEFIEGQHAEMSRKLVDGLSNTEEKAFSLMKNVVDQIKAQKNSPIPQLQKRTDGGKFYEIKVQITASMGCTPYAADPARNEDDELKPDDVESRFNLLDTRSQTAEGAAKLAGRNRAHGIDEQGGQFSLNDEQNLEKI